MLLHVIACYCMLLHVVACCCVLHGCLLLVDAERGIRVLTIVVVIIVVTVGAHVCVGMEVKWLLLLIGIWRCFPLLFNHMLKPLVIHCSKIWCKWYDILLLLSLLLLLLLALMFSSCSVGMELER